MKAKQDGKVIKKYKKKTNTSKTQNFKQNPGKSEKSNADLRCFGINFKF